MTEQQIIERIQKTSDASELNNQLRMTHQMQDYIHQLQDGEKTASAEWLNSSPQLFPDDLTDEMSQLSSELAMSDKLLKQLGRIETAITMQLEKLSSSQSIP